MATFTLEESDFAGYMPEDDVKTSTVTSVKLVTKPYKDDDGSDVKKVEFKFRISDGSEHDGTDIWGETGTRFNTHPDCKLRNWASAILGMNLPAGFNLETDVLVGKTCRLIIGYKEYVKKDGTPGKRNFVKDIMPSAEAMAGMARAAEEEPF